MTRKQARIATIRLGAGRKHANRYNSNINEQKQRSVAGQNIDKRRLVHKHTPPSHTLIILLQKLLLLITAHGACHGSLSDAAAAVLVLTVVRRGHCQ